jgi:4,5-DOPA dioxygenase extradiol
MPIPEIVGPREAKGMPPRMPVLFVGHGSPMNEILDNGYTRSLADLGGRLCHDRRRSWSSPPAG